jgi:hypothetical protein
LSLLDCRCNRTRVRGLQEALSAATVALEISGRNARVAALQERWDRLRAGLDLILQHRGRTWPICPATPEGCWCAATRGRKPTGW